MRDITKGMCKSDIASLYGIHRETLSEWLPEEIKTKVGWRKGKGRQVFPPYKTLIMTNFLDGREGITQ